MSVSIRVIVVLAIAIGAAGPIYGQTASRHTTASQVPRYTPQSPTVSPYLSLLSRNGSAAGNYYGLVRPLERQRVLNDVQQQQAASQQQELTNIRTQQQFFEQPTVKPTGTAGWFQNTGATSPYQVTSHYYGQWPAPRSKAHGASIVRH